MNKYDDFKQTVSRAVGARFFSVEFTKKDGSLRQMTVQLPAGKKFGGKNSDAAAKRKLSHPNLWNVFDVRKQAMRTINIDTISRISLNGQEIRV